LAGAVVMDSMMLWNILLTCFLGLAAFLLKFMWAELQRVQILLNKTREEMYRNGLAADRRNASELTQLLKALQTQG
jgi:hypothetical protein